MIEPGNETYLDIAKRNLKVARNIFREAADEGELNIAAYLTQQSVEFALKHYIEADMGEQFPYSHDIGDLIAIIGEDVFPELYPWSGTITLMESKTRYIKNYRLSKKVISDVMLLAEKTIEKIEEIEKNA